MRLFGPAGLSIVLLAGCAGGGEVHGPHHPGPVPYLCGDGRLAQITYEDGGWFVRAGDGFRMYANDGRSMGASYIADVTVMRPGAPSMHVEANFRVENGEIVGLFLQPM